MAVNHAATIGSNRLSWLRFTWLLGPSLASDARHRAGLAHVDLDLRVGRGTASGTVLPGVESCPTDMRIRMRIPTGW